MFQVLKHMAALAWVLTVMLAALSTGGLVGAIVGTVVFGDAMLGVAMGLVAGIAVVAALGPGSIA